MLSKFTRISVLFLFLAFSFSSAACRKEQLYEYNDDSDLKVLHEKTYQISPGKSLKLKSSSGDIMLTTWDKPEVYVKILGNEKAEDKIEFSFENNENVVEITAKKEGSFFNSSSGIRLKFEIKVPTNFNPDLYTAGGDIRLAGISGDVLAKTSGGNISVKYTSGELNISTSGGNLSLDDTKGNIKGSTSGGNIEASRFEGSLDVSTSGGNISLDGANSEINASTSGGDIQLKYSGENKGIELETSGGNIKIYLPSDFNAYAKLSTSGGDVDCDLTANNAKKISSTSFEADLNKGGNMLIAKTSGGSVSVRKN